MTEREVIQMLRKHFEGLSSEFCPKCDRVFTTLRECLIQTRRVGTSISYDIELGDWNPSDMVGSVALANCPCGTSMALATAGMPLSESHLILQWLREETQRIGARPQELLDHNRDEIRQQLLANPVPTVGAGNGGSDSI